MYTNITGIILAGGKSTRMGQNKSLLKIKDETIIERVVDLMSPLFPELLLITNTFEEYSFLTLPMYRDFVTGIGPLAGIHSGLLNSNTDKNFIISCDIPLMNKGVIEFLVDYTTDKPITIAKADNFIQQLCGVYNKSVLPFAEEIMLQNLEEEQRNPEQKKRGCRVLELVKLAEGEIVDIEKEYKDYIPGTYYNMNNPSEYGYILNILLNK